MSKQDELQYEQQEKRIQAQSDAFITLLTKRGILGDSQIDDAQKRAARQEKTKNCYHNTLMLLQHYRTLVWMLECFPETVAAELDRPFEGVDKLIEDVDVEVALGNKKIESRIHSAGGAQSSGSLVSVEPVFTEFLSLSSAGHFRSFHSFVGNSCAGCGLLVGDGDASGRTEMNMPIKRRKVGTRLPMTRERECAKIISSQTGIGQNRRRFLS